MYFHGKKTDNCVIESIFFLVMTSKRCRRESVKIGVLFIYLLNLITQIVKIVNLKIEKNIYKSDICITRTVCSEREDSL